MIELCQIFLELQIRYPGFSSAREAWVTESNFRNQARKEICSFTPRENKAISCCIWVLETGVRMFWGSAEKYRIPYINHYLQDSIFLHYRESFHLK